LEDNDLLSTALEHQSVGVAVLRLPDLVYEYVNPAFQAFAPGKEMLGHPNDEVFPEMSFLEPHVLASLKRVGQSWHAENLLNRIRRTYDGPLEEVYGTFEISLVEIHGSHHLLVTAVETTASALLSEDYERLRAEEMQRLSFAQTLDRVNGVIHSSLDYDEVMQRALEEATKALGARAGAVFVGLNGESEARHVFGFPQSLLGRKFSADAFAFSRLMEEKKQPIPIGDDDIGVVMNPALARLFRVRSLMAIPLVVRGRLIGGIGLIYNRPHEFVQSEIDFSAGFGASVSLALENAELYRRQERVADTLQEALLTLPDHIPGLVFAHAYNSAAEMAKVGGDFYDLFELEHDRVGITVGDISGKGLEAAVLTSLVKHSIRAQAMDKRNSPASVLRVVNKVLHEGSSPESFATVFFGILDCRNGQLVYCNAGHTTSAIVRLSGHVERLPSNSQLVGAFHRSPFKDGRAALGVGDTLFMYTDGVTEARSGKTFFGEERLMHSLHDGDSDPERLVQRVIEEVLEFSGGRLLDDVAILAVKRETRRKQPDGGEQS
jgi:serine phosphatase RsbU (regulator of sigma subunit)